MSTNLYEVLGISRNAAPEDVRRAYRRKALETHPDRLPPGASEAEKAASEDLFRKINNAYEVLSDQQRRASYDQYGVWPPPASQQTPYANGPREPFPEPFFREPFSSPFSRGARVDPFGGFGFGAHRHPGGFTDPFVLFNSIFGDFQRAFDNDPFFDDAFGHRGFGPSRFGGGFFNGSFPSVMPMPSPMDDFGRGGMGGRTQMFSGSNGGNGGRWISQSWSSSTVNGVTHAKSVRKDSQGNEHVVYRYPDGTERRTINGVEQSGSQPMRALPPSAPPVPPASYPTPPPPPYSEAVGQQPYRSRSSRHVHYDDQSGDRHRHRHEPRDKDRGREYGYGYRDDGHGRETQSGSNWWPRRS